MRLMETRASFSLVHPNPDHFNALNSAIGVYLLEKNSI